MRRMGRRTIRRRRRRSRFKSWSVLVLKYPPCLGVHLLAELLEDERLTRNLALHVVDVVLDELLAGPAVITFRFDTGLFCREKSLEGAGKRRGCSLWGPITKTCRRVRQYWLRIN